MSKIIKGICFDKTLSQKEDLDFYFISSKDNIVVDFQNQLRCHNRKDIVKSSKSFVYYGKELVLVQLYKKTILMDKVSFNHLSYRNYSAYKIIETGKIYSKYGHLYTIEFFKRSDYFENL